MQAGSPLNTAPVIAASAGTNSLLQASERSRQCCSIRTLVRLLDLTALEERYYAPQHGYFIGAKLGAVCGSIDVLGPGFSAAASAETCGSSSSELNLQRMPEKA